MKNSDDWLYLGTGVETGIKHQQLLSLIKCELIGVGVPGDFNVESILSVSEFYNQLAPIQTTFAVE